MEILRLWPCLGLLPCLVWRGRLDPGFGEMWLILLVLKSFLSCDHMSWIEIKLLKGFCGSTSWCLGGHLCMSSSMSSTGLDWSGCKFVDVHAKLQARGRSEAFETSCFHVSIYMGSPHRFSRFIFLVASFTPIEYLTTWSPVYVISLRRSAYSETK